MLSVSSIEMRIKMSNCIFFLIILKHSKLCLLKHCVCVFETSVARDNVTDNFHRLSDINNEETAEHQHDYYNVDNSSRVNKETPYEQLSVDTQPPVVYQQIAPR